MQTLKHWLGDVSRSHDVCPSVRHPCDQVIKYGEPLDELQRDELRTAVEKLRRQMLRKSREYDCQILQERMELLHQAHQVPAAGGQEVRRSLLRSADLLWRMCLGSLEENSSTLNPSLECWKRLGGTTAAAPWSHDPSCDQGAAAVQGSV